MSPLHTEILHLLKTTYKIQEEIALKLDCSKASVSRVANTYLTHQERYLRSLKSECRSWSRPRGELNWNFKHGLSNEGYKRIPRPAWFKGHNRSAVFEHVIVACQASGITSLPYGYVVHHIDCNKLNNEPNNLLIVSRANHTRIHHQIVH